MAEFGLTQLTIPTPQPYDAKDPTRQLENLCYVALQMLSFAKAAGFVVRDNLAGVETKLDELKWNTIVLDLWPLGKIYGQYGGPAVREG
jgi:hypothetical protein